MRKLKLLFTILIAATTIAAGAQEIDVSADKVVLENPEIDMTDDESSVQIPTFIHTSANRINFNGVSWGDLGKELRREKRPISFVHIGDSHIQADIATSMVRDNLQFDYGNAGRGLISPLKMSGSNQPSDYIFSSTSGWTSAKLMKLPWKQTMGFTGASVAPLTHTSSITVGTRENDWTYNPFTSVTLFHNGMIYVTKVEDAQGNLIPFINTPSKDYTHLRLARETTSAKVYFETLGDMTLFGANLSGERPGIFYHTIGNNGATFDTYNRIGNVGEGIAPLQPELVIISLGTNEAFGRTGTQQFTRSIDRLVSNIKAVNPKARLLLVTPMECQRSVSTSVATRSKKGKRVYKKVRSYKVNPNVATIREAILDYGKEHNIPVYDWYEVAGGAGASEKWVGSNLFSKDRIHLSAKGYHLQGQLLYEALHNALIN